MCSRYEVKVPVERIIERFGLLVSDFTFPARVSNGEIRPTDLALVIGPDACPSLLNWGLSVSWQKQPLINARSETVAEKPTFRHLLEQRVLIPASAYFEWRKDGRRKIKTRIAPADDELFAFAGFADDERFVMLTCAPADKISHIHNRMPVILPADAEDAWLDPDTPFTDLEGVLVPYNGPFGVTEPVELPRVKPSAQHSLFD